MAGTINVDEHAALGFILVLCAGLSTGIGAAAVYCKPIVDVASKKVLAGGIGLSAGVMLYVSFIEIFHKAVGAFEEGSNEKDAYAYATICFFAGVAVFKVIGLVVHRLDKDGVHCDHGPVEPPTFAKPMQRGSAADPAGVQVNVEAGEVEGAVEATDPPRADEMSKPAAEKNKELDEANQKLTRMGVNTAVAIAFHNFPEGLATFVGTIADPVVGATLAVAIAIHNVPEGLCVALPIYYAQGNRLKAFFLALASGLSEPIGAAFGYCIIKLSGDDMSQIVYGVLFGIVGGMMVAIALDEMLPTAHRYDPEGKVVSASCIAGMVVMASSLVLFLY